MSETLLAARGNRQSGAMITLLLFALCVQIMAQDFPVSEPMSRGQQLFSSTCSACHGLDGRGSKHGPDIATSSGVQRLSDSVLTQIISQGRPHGGMPGFALTFKQDQIEAIVKHLRVLQGQTATGLLSGDPGRGRTIFFEGGRCSACHMVVGQGGFLGGDLSDYGKTHSPEGVRESVLHPDKDMDARHGLVIVLTRAGKRYSGVLRNEDNFSLQMQTADGVFHFFNRLELTRVEHSAKPLMPSDYGKALTPSQLDDLVSFLMNAHFFTDGISRETSDSREQLTNSNPRQ